MPAAQQPDRDLINMSFDAMLWANKDAPVKDVYERAVLGVMSEPASDDGTGSCLAVKTIATRTRLSEREVRSCQKSMLERGLLALGDQSIALRYHRADRLPTVYDLMIPYSMFANIRRVNEGRANHGLDPLTPASRPDIADPPPKTRRSDLGKKRPRRDKTDGVTDSPPVESPPETGTGGLQAPHGVTTRTSAPYIEPVFEPLLLTAQSNAPAEPPPDPPVVVVDHGDPQPPSQAVAVLEAAQRASKLPVGRMVRGEQLATLAALLAERLDAGWTEQDATDALTGGFNGGSVFGVLRYRINNNLAGPPPTANKSVPPPRRYARPWCGRCAGATTRRYVDPDTGAATTHPCPNCATDQPLASTMV